MASHNHQLLGMLAESQGRSSPEALLAEAAREHPHQRCCPKAWIHEAQLIPLLVSE